MSILNWAIFFILSIAAFFPIVHMDLFKVDSKYIKFKYVSLTLLLWCIIQAYRYLTDNPSMLYYLTLSIYPVVYLITILLFFAFNDYLEIKINKVLKAFLWLFLLINTTITFTNGSHQWMLQLVPNNQITFETFITAQYGWFFYIHMFISYVLLITVIVQVVIKLYKNVRSNQDYVPFLLVTLGIIAGISANLVHVFLHTFIIDPTFIAFVIVISLLYYVFYMRDLKLILGFDRNRFILKNLREKYVLVNDKGLVVDASQEFLNSLNIDLSDNYSFENLLTEVKKTAVVYEDVDEIDDADFEDDKLYFNMSQNKIHLPFYKYSGHFYLFYDETSNRKYVRDMHYIKTHDLMTKLFNRNYVEEIRSSLDKSITPYHVVMFDIDGLKMFNDYLGHNAGDALLKRFAKMMLKFQSKDIIPVRLGGDEFIYVFKNQDIKNVEFVIEQLKKANSNKPLIETVHFSYGIISRTSKKESLNVLLKKVDLAMYNDKNSKEDYKIKLQKALEDINKKNS